MNKTNKIRPKVTDLFFTPKTRMVFQNGQIGSKTANNCYILDMIYTKRVLDP
jgi:hypothetical protein